MTPDLPRGAVTFVFTDVEGSTRLAQRLGSRWADVLSAHRDLVRTAFERHSGHEIDAQGDSFFFAFAHSRDALLAAADAQRELAHHAWPDGVTLRVRIGVHSGQARLADGRYVGPAVHRAARIGAAANGGQVLVSGTAHDLLEDEESLEGLGLRYRGRFRLKDFDRAERLYELEGDRLRRAAPRAQQVKWSRRRTVVAAAVVVAAAAIALPLALMGSGSSAAVVVEPNSVAALDPHSGRVVTDVPVGFGPAAVAVGSGSVWISNLVDRTVSRVDEHTRRVVQTIPVAAQVGALAVGDGGVWLAGQGTTGTMTRIEPQSGTVVTTVSLPFPHAQLLGSAGRGVGFAGGSVWMAYAITTSIGLGVLARIDPADNRIVSLIEEPFSVKGSAVGLGSVWITDSSEELIRLSSETGAIEDKVTLSDLPGAVAVGAGSVWVVLPFSQSLVRVRSAAPGLPFAVDGVVKIGKGADAVAVGDGSVWVTNSADGTVSKVDAVSDRLLATIRVGGAPAGIAVGGGHAWVTVAAPP